MTRLILIRHGETVWNGENRFQGTQDSPLSERGRVQAEALRGRFEHEAIDALYTSPLGRARSTAEPIAAATGRSLEPDERLKEKSYGLFEGLTFDEIREKHPGVLENYRQGDASYAAPGGGESYEMISGRVRTCLEELATRHTGGRVIVVTHGGVIITVFRFLLNLPHDEARELALVNGALHHLKFTDGAWSAERLCDADHLREPTRSSPYKT